MATPNNIVPHWDKFFKTQKPAFLFTFKIASHAVSGSGEGPQIGDSVGDRTQNLWFHKRIKLGLELGILAHMVH